MNAALARYYFRNEKIQITTLFYELKFVVRQAATSKIIRICLLKSF